MKKKTRAAHSLSQYVPKITEVIFVLPVVALLLAFLVLTQHFISQKGEMEQGTLTSGVGLPPLPVSITSPKDDETVSGQVTVTLVNPLGRNFQKLEFWVDRQLEKKFDAAAAEVSDKLYEVDYKLDTTKYADGEHVLSVISLDMQGKYQTFPVKVNFANKQSFSTNKQSLRSSSLDKLGTAGLKQSLRSSSLDKLGTAGLKQSLRSSSLDKLGTAGLKQSFSTNKTALR